MKRSEMFYDVDANNIIINVISEYRTTEECQICYCDLNSVSKNGCHDSSTIITKLTL